MVLNVAGEAIAGRNFTHCLTKIYFLNSYFFKTISQKCLTLRIELKKSFFGKGGGDLAPLGDGGGGFAFWITIKKKDIIMKNKLANKNSQNFR